MLTFVIYDSTFGNTEKIASAIARGARSRGSVRVMSVAEATPLAERPDLLLVGGPTQKRAASPALRGFLDALPGSLAGAPAAAFDTRYHGSTWLMGSAAAEAAKRLARAGSPIVAPPESFFVGRKGPLERQALEAGELERAEEWGRVMATLTAKGQPAGAFA